MSSSRSHDDNGGWRTTWETGGDVDYSSIGIPTEQRDQIRELRDELGFETYALLLDELIENAQEDLSAE
jgi:hypothetical protein